MANRNGRKGTGFEVSVLPAFQELWPDAHRLGKQGVKDKGDIWLPTSVPFVVECKNEASYGGKLSTWIGEAAVEAAHADKPHGIVVHKRIGKTDPGLQYVALELRSFLELVSARPGC